MLRRSLALSFVALLVALSPGCASTDDKPEEDSTQHYMARANDGKPKNLGFIIAEIDGSLRQWASLAATGDRDKDGPRSRALAEELRHRSRKYFALLTSELESGPVRNRMVAAMALGFSNNPDALSMLLAALEDEDERVEINALIGLSVLASENTPLSLLTYRMREHSNPQARAMASSAIVYCVEAGAIGTDVESTARLGLIDAEPVVRMRSSLILAKLGDSESVESIAALLYDEIPLVRRAARESITNLGMSDPHIRGEAARALATALSKAESDSDEASLILYLRLLSNANHGDKVEDWVDWANQMP